jgi:microcystin-dependent protein
MGQGPGLANYNLGAVGGTESVTLNATQLPAHTHPITGNVTVTLKAANTSGQNTAPLQGDFIAVTNDPNAGQIPSFVTNPPVANQITLGGVTSATAGLAAGPNTGGGAPHPNMQPYLGMRYIIATQGVYPMRP